MKLFFRFFCFFLFFYSCGQSYNSNTGDERYNQNVGAADAAAIQVISSNCLTCHSEWSTYTTAAAYAGAGLLVTGSPDTSKIIYRIKNFNGAESNMPTNAGPLTPGDYETLRNWVTNAAALVPKQTNATYREILFRECVECWDHFKDIDFETMNLE